MKLIVRLISTFIKWFFKNDVEYYKPYRANMLGNKIKEK